MKKYYLLLFFLLLVSICSNLAVAQVTQVKRVVSSGGGLSESATFQNFGVVGESIFQTTTAVPQTPPDTLTSNIGFLMTEPNPTEESTSADDSLVLVSIYNQTGGDTWTNSWDLDTLVSTWYGVTSVAGVVYQLHLSNNNLTGVLPGTVTNFIRIDEQGFTVDVGDNALGFDSAEPLVDRIDNFTYQPQAKVNDLLTETLLEGENITFRVETGGTANQYQWTKDGNLINGATLDSLVLEQLSLTDAGIYSCIITNTIATELTLERNDIELVVQAYLDELDSLALVKMFLETGGETDWIRPWNLEDPVATWEGVTLVGNKIIALDLSSRNITGVLPEVFDAAIFTELVYVSYFNNHLQKGIPTTFGTLSKLEYLDLGKNEFEGSPPIELANLKNLSTLWLSRNQLDIIPDAYGQISSLRNFFVHENKLKSLPEELFDLSELRIFNFSDNELTIFSEKITQLPHLERLYAGGNLFTSIPTVVTQLSELTHLDISNNQLDSLPTGLADLSKLIHFDIANNQFDFGDINPIIDLNISAFSYAPQAPLNTVLDTLLKVGDEYTLSVESEGEGNTYQWLQDNTILTEATESDLVLTFALPSHAGRYIALVNNPKAPDLTLFRNPLSISVDCGSAINASISTQDATEVCEGFNFAANLQVTSNVDVSVQWLKNGDKIFLANEQNFVATQAGIYQAEVKDAGGCVVFTNEITIVVNSAPLVTIRQEGDKLIASTEGEGTNFQWIRNNIPYDAPNDSSIVVRESGTYRVQIQDANGCTGLSNLLQVNITGIEDDLPETIFGIKLYPNPTTDIFYLELDPSLTGNIGVTISDNLGREVFKQNLTKQSSNTYTFSLKDFATGNYLIEIETEKGKIKKRLIKE
jgi:hypothetical protein